ncbi:hypothetical protein DUNSADRAFT_12911 [Dunaliella salina]|uniref:Encoded protein n=1 Tax=Dunaliella salina TaxID=3046 RepID=A0ABQ7GAG2_DUNSA|nr:hypothetical protein DUNSADRAFT_12911 [Dunaliella salina]|eukprot:KAF5831599.1 hypothetical protein DUNSADRAFT_12911 [Dunaliella salina]
MVHRLCQEPIVSLEQSLIEAIGVACFVCTIQGEQLLAIKKHVHVLANSLPFFLHFTHTKMVQTKKSTSHTKMVQTKN